MLKMHTPNKVDENIAKIGKLFPNCLTERKNDAGEVEHAIDFDVLRLLQETYLGRVKMIYIDDSIATNFEQIFATYSPETIRKVL